MATFRLSTAPGSKFASEEVGDVLIYPATSAQNIHIGNMSGSKPTLSLSQNFATVNGSVITGGLYTHQMQAGSICLTMDSTSVVPVADPTYCSASARAIGSFAAPVDGGVFAVDLGDADTVVYLSHGTAPLTLNLVYAGNPVMPASIAGTVGTIRLVERSLTGRTVTLDPRMASSSDVPYTSTTSSYTTPAVDLLTFTVGGEHTVAYTKETVVPSAVERLSAVILNGGDIQQIACGADGSTCMSVHRYAMPNSLCDEFGSIVDIQPYAWSDAPQTSLNEYLVYRLSEKRDVVEVIFTDMPTIGSTWSSSPAVQSCMLSDGVCIVAFQTTADLTPVDRVRVFKKTINLRTRTSTVELLVRADKPAGVTLNPVLIVALAANGTAAWGSEVAMWGNNLNMQAMSGDGDMVVMALSSDLASFSTAKLYGPLAGVAHSVLLNLDYGFAEGGLGSMCALCAFDSAGAYKWNASINDGGADACSLSVKGDTVALACTVASACNLTLVDSSHNVAGIILASGHSGLVRTIVADFDGNGILRWAAESFVPGTLVGAAACPNGSVFFSFQCNNATPLVGSANGATLAIAGTTVGSNLGLVKYTSSGTAAWFAKASGIDSSHHALCQNICSTADNGCVHGISASNNAVSLVSGGNGTVVLTVPSTPTWAARSVTAMFDGDGVARWYVVSKADGYADLTAVGACTDGSVWTGHNTNTYGIGTLVMTDSTGGTKTLVAAHNDNAQIRTALQRVTADGRLLGSSASGAVSASPKPDVLYRNMLVNGDMRLNSANIVGLQVGGTFGNDGAYVLDRWRAYRETDQWSGDNGKYTFDQVAVDDLGGFTHALRIVNTKGIVVPVYQGLVQVVDAAKLAGLGWGTANGKALTLSFWIKSTLGAAMFGIIGTDNVQHAQLAITQVFGALYSVDRPDAWEHKTIVISPPPVGSSWANGLVLTFTFSQSGGMSEGITDSGWAQYTGGWGVTPQSDITLVANATLHITGVQLEEGMLATGFELRPLGVERLLAANYDVATPADSLAVNDVAVIADAVNKVVALNGCTFLRAGQATRECGLIAQDVVAVLPEAVRVLPDTGMMGVAYGSIVGLLVQSIKELSVRLLVQEARVTWIQGAIFDVRAGSLSSLSASTSSTSVAAWGPFVQTDLARQPTYTASGGYNGQGYVSMLGSRFLQFGRAVAIPYLSGGGFTFSCVYRVTGPIGYIDPLIYIASAVNPSGYQSDLLKIIGDVNTVSASICVFLEEEDPLLPTREVLNFTVVPDTFVGSTWKTLIVRYTAANKSYNIYTTDGIVPSMTGVGMDSIQADYMTDVNGPLLGLINNGVDQYINMDFSSVMLVTRPLTDSEIASHYQDITIY
jgi:hypothetical protein